MIKGINLKIALKRLDITQSNAAEKLGVSRQTVVTWIGRSEIDADTCKLIRHKLGIDLSLFNEQPEIINPKGRIINANTNRRNNSALIPFYNADFIAGKAEEYYEDATIYPEYYMDIPEFSGCTAFKAYSDSMEKLISSGSILFGTKIDQWRSHLEFGQIYGIVCTDGRKYLKRIRKSKDSKDHFILRSENENYDDMDIHLNDIKNIWLIDGWINKNT